MSDLADQATDPVLETIRGSHDALSVRRVFGDAYMVDDMTIIPVARVAGGAGGGAGEGDRDAAEEGSKTTGNGEGEGSKSDPAKAASGSGYGSGFGLGVTPVGVYQVRDGAVEWKPMVDVNRMARGGQILAGIIAICLAVVVVRRG